MRTIKTFIIEDDPMVLSINCKFLQRVDGFEVIGTERTGRDGIEGIKKKGCDLVLLDIYIPELNGLEIAREIREQDISADIIMITAATDSSIVTQSLRLGVVDYIIKPYNFARFSDAMKRYKNRFYSLNFPVLSQEMLDNITNPPFMAEDIDKGIDKETLYKIKNYMLESNIATTAEKLAEALDISRVTARRYLEYMVKDGTVSYENIHQRIGRPEKIYKMNI